MDPLLIKLQNKFPVHEHQLELQIIFLAGKSVYSNSKASYKWLILFLFTKVSIVYLQVKDEQLLWTQLSQAMEGDQEYSWNMKQEHHYLNPDNLCSSLVWIMNTEEFTL